LIVTYTLVNGSGRIRDGLVLEAGFPEGVLIRAIDDPLGGKVVSGAGGNTLRIEQLALPPGEQVIVLRVWVEAGVSVNPEGSPVTQASFLSCSSCQSCLPIILLILSIPARYPTSVGS